MSSTKDFYSEDNVPASNWMKFDKVGDSVKWTFKEKFNKAWTGVMPDQVVFTLVKADLDKLECGEGWKIIKVLSTEKNDWEINVAVKASNSYVLSRMKNIQPWDIIWFAFVEEIAPKTKGYNPAKSIKPFIVWKDEDYIKDLMNAEEGADIDASDIPFS